ncbi:MAG: DsbC family protein [Betaproteobacteria bacterium]
MDAKTVAVSGLVLGALLSLTAHADERAIRNVVKDKIPDAEILSVRKLPYAGLYEVGVRRPDGLAVYYTDDSAEVILVGTLLDTRSDRDLTEERLRELSKVDWRQLPFHWSVTTRRGDGRRQIAIFSDPNCPFCRRFEEDLATVDDITIHIFMWPVIKPESVRQAKSVWCSNDRAKAWNDLMLKGIEPAAPIDCENPIDELIALGRRLGARSTPTWFLPNGEKYMGALPMSKVVPLLDAAATGR